MMSYCIQRSSTAAAVLLRGRWFSRLPDIVSLKGLVFHARHGCYAAEQELGQKFIVDLDIECDIRPAAATDSLKHAINYDKVYSQVKEIMEMRQYRLLESVAETIAAEILYEHPDAKATKVSVKKPQVALPGVLDYSAVTIRRDRSDYKYDVEDAKKTNPDSQ